MKKIFKTLRPNSKSRKTTGSISGILSDVQNAQGDQEDHTNESEMPSGSGNTYHNFQTDPADDDNNASPFDRNNGGIIADYEAMHDSGQNSWASEPSSKDPKPSFDVSKFFTETTSVDPESGMARENETCDDIADKRPEHGNQEIHASFQSELNEMELEPLRDMQVVLDNSIESALQSFIEDLSIKKEIGAAGDSKRPRHEDSRSRSENVSPFDITEDIPISFPQIDHLTTPIKEKSVSGISVSVPSSTASDGDILHEKNSPKAKPQLHAVIPMQEHQDEADFEGREKGNITVSDLPSRQSISLYSLENSLMGSHQTNLVLHGTNQLEGVSSKETLGSFQDDAKVIVEPHLKQLFKRSYSSESSEMGSTYNSSNHANAGAVATPLTRHLSSRESLSSFVPSAKSIITREVDKQRNLKRDYTSRLGFERRYSDPIPLSTLLSNDPSKMEPFMQENRVQESAALQNRKLLLETKLSCPDFKLVGQYVHESPHRWPISSNLINFSSSNKEHAIDDEEVDKVIQETHKMLSKALDIEKEDISTASASSSGDQLGQGSKNERIARYSPKVEPPWENKQLIRSPGRSNVGKDSLVFVPNNTSSSGQDETFLIQSDDCCGGSGSRDTSYRLSRTAALASFRNVQRYCDSIPAGTGDPRIIGDIINDLHCVFEKTFGQNRNYETQVVQVQDDLDDCRADLEECQNCRSFLEQEVIKLQAEVEATQQAFDEEVERRILLEGLVAQLKAQLIRLETLSESDAIEKSQLANCLKEAEMKLRELTNMVQCLELERDQLLRNCRGFEEIRDRHTETINVSEGRCDQLEEALAKCCRANEELQREIQRLREAAKEFACLESQLRAEIKRLLEQLNRERACWDCERERFEMTISDLKTAYADLVEQNEEVCQKMNEVVSAHHSEMDCLRKEAEKFKAFYEAEKHERERLEKALRDCEERKAQMQMQRVQQPSNSYYDPCGADRYVERAEVDRWKATYDASITSLEAKYKDSFKKQLNAKIAEITAELERQSRDRLLIDQMRAANEDARRSEHEQITSTLKSEIKQLKRDVKSRDEEIATLKSSMSRMKDKYTSAVTQRVELMNLVKNLELESKSSSALLNNKK